MDESTRNEVSGTVDGVVVQAGVIHGGVHVHSPDDRRLANAYEEVERVRRQLAESVAAERDITKVVWVLQVVLAQARATVAHLTGDRDHLRDEADRRRAELARARQAQARTEQRLRRAEQERENALRLVEVARRKARALQARTHRETPAHYPPAHSLPALEPAALEAGLDNVDAYLDAQDDRLDRLSTALGTSPADQAPHPPTEDRRPEVLLPLVAALLRMPALAEASNRSTIIRLVGHELGTGLVVPESAHPTVHLSNLVLACLEHSGGLSALLRVLDHVEHDSTPMREARRAVDELTTGQS
ncbi:hypothetical protein JOF41_002970 [Saccharothrix coeruleofusca]|uniref:effector-associated domain 2-containing protein n=1 Tax=Saccharothrix coeruleofusca TaxID=33919 RepID=UPI001AE67524|nr:hypothetical protein [Saccharothrix coeruleofusca]MBP2336792.1 hypothetical protein [Saccharothrix coeruleofusca]